MNIILSAVAEYMYYVHSCVGIAHACVGIACVGIAHACVGRYWAQACECVCVGVHS